MDCAEELCLEALRERREPDHEQIMALRGFTLQESIDFVHAVLMEHMRQKYLIPIANGEAIPEPRHSGISPKRPNANRKHHRESR